MFVYHTRLFYVYIYFLEAVLRTAHAYPIVRLRQIVPLLTRGEATTWKTSPAYAIVMYQPKKTACFYPAPFYLFWITRGALSAKIAFNLEPKKSRYGKRYYCNEFGNRRGHICWSGYILVFSWVSQTQDRPRPVRSTGNRLQKILLGRKAPAPKGGNILAGCAANTR